MNTPPDDLRLRAYVDGELDAAAATEVEARLARDPEAAAFVARERALREALRSAFAPVLDEPVPQRLQDALKDELPAASARVDRGRGAAANRAWWTALAAALVLGIGLGSLRPQGEPLLSPQADRLVAGAGLAEALAARPGGRSAPADPVQVAWSYRNRAGDYCRTFSLPRERLAGAACREAGVWSVQVLARQDAAGGGDYRPAATTLPPAVLQAVDAQIDGEPLDAAAEAAALQQGWSR